MRGFDLAAYSENPDQPGFLVDAQHLAQLGRAMPEDAEENLHILLQQTQHQRFGEAETEPTRQAFTARQQVGVFLPLAGQFRLIRFG